MTVTQNTFYKALTNVIYQGPESLKRGHVGVGIKLKREDCSKPRLTIRPGT